MRAIIIEDEKRASNRLIRVLNEVSPEIEIIAVLESITESILLLKQKPELDVIFSDIQLADNLSFEIYAQAEIAAPIKHLQGHQPVGIKQLRKILPSHISKTVMNGWRLWTSEKC